MPTASTTTNRRFAASTETFSDCDGFDMLSIGTRLSEVTVTAYNPHQDRPSHLSVRTHDVTDVRVDTFTTDRGEPSVTIRTRNEHGVDVEFTVWGVTLDTLASAVEAASRAA